MNWLLRMYQGRINRKEFVVLSLVAIACTIAINLVGMFIAASMGQVLFPPVVLFIFPFIALAISLLIGLLTWHISVRRLHDFGRSGWWMLAVAIATIALPAFAGPLNILFLVLLLFVPGTAGANHYGDAPDRWKGFLNTFFNR